MPRRARSRRRSIVRKFVPKQRIKSMSQRYLVESKSGPGSRTYHRTLSAAKVRAAKLKRAYGEVIIYDREHKRNVRFNTLDKDLKFIPRARRNTGIAAGAVFRRKDPRDGTWDYVCVDTVADGWVYLVGTLTHAAAVEINKGAAGPNGQWSAANHDMPVSEFVRGGWKRVAKVPAAWAAFFRSHGVRKNSARRRNGRAAPVDEHAATELTLYVTNNYALYQRAQRAFIPNLAKKMAKGVYSPAMAAKLWEYLAKEGAQMYAKEFSVGSDWGSMFSPATRAAAAKDIEAHYREEVTDEAAKIKRKNPSKSTRRHRQSTATYKYQSKAAGSRWEHRFAGERRHIKKLARKAKRSVGTRRKNPGSRGISVVSAPAKGGYPYWRPAMYIAAVRKSDGAVTWRLAEHGHSYSTKRGAERAAAEWSTITGVPVISARHGTRKNPRSGVPTAPGGWRRNGEINDRRQSKGKPGLGFVVFTDSALSGWGGAAGGRSLYALAVDNIDEHDVVMANGKNRSEMKRGRFVKAKANGLPDVKLGAKDHLSITDRHNAERWYRWRGFN